MPNYIISQIPPSTRYARPMAVVLWHSAASPQRSSRRLPLSCGTEAPQGLAGGVCFSLPSCRAELAACRFAARRRWQAKPAWPWRATQDDESGTRDAPTRNQQLRCHFRDKACPTCNKPAPSEKRGTGVLRRSRAAVATPFSPRSSNCQSPFRGSSGGSARSIHL